MVEAKRLDDADNESSLAQIIATIEATTDENIRRESINTVIKEGKVNGGRVLIKLYYLTMWREIKMDIIEALGEISHERISAFLIEICEQHEDLPLARKACFALGQNNCPLAKSYLLNVAQNSHHILFRETVIGLSKNFFTADIQQFSKTFDELINLSQPDYILTTLIGAIGASRNSDFFRYLVPFLNKTCLKDRPEVFMATLAALSTVGGKKALQLLQTFSHHEDFTIQNLTNLTKDKISLRLTIKIEDILAKISSSPHYTYEDFSLLREFPKQQAWNAYQLLLDDKEVHKSALIRIALFFPERISEDLNWLMACHKEIDPIMTVTLLRLHLEKSPTLLPSLLKDEKLDLLFEMGGYHYAPELLKIMLIELKSGNEDRQERVVNSLVRLVIAKKLSEEEISQVYKQLLRTLKNSPSFSVGSRIVRALGQMRCTDQDYLDILQNKLTNAPNYRGSALYALTHIGSTKSLGLITRFIRNKCQAKNKNEDKDISLALQLLASHNLPINLDFLNLLPDYLVKENVMIILKLLTQSAAPQLRKIVKDNLESEAFYSQLLALAASRLHMDKDITEVLARLCFSSNICIAERSLDSLLKSKHPEAIKTIIKIAKTSPLRTEQKLKMFQKIEFGEDLDTQSLRAELRKIGEKEKDPEVLDAILNLRQTLRGLNKPIFQDDNFQSLDSSHDIDEDLKKHFKCFDEFPDEVKATLRNAEITFKNPALFDTRVDKSTIFVEYVKAIDLLLQFNLGPKIFEKNKDDTLIALQSRVFQLQLDNPRNMSNSLVSDLQCERFFSQAQMPYQKIIALSQDILTGRFVEKRFHCIDGIRAWSVIFLLFCRRFKYNGFFIEPVWHLNDGYGDEICMVAAEMNELQLIRNQAAHRGTVVNISELINARSKAFVLIEKSVELTRHK